MRSTATLAALPLLLVYLQLAWTVVLLGAELGYAVQNLHVLGPARDPSRLPFALRERLALRLVERAVAAHERGDGPLPLTAEAQAIDVPREWLERVVGESSAMRSSSAPHEAACCQAGRARGCRSATSPWPCAATSTHASRPDSPSRRRSSRASPAAWRPAVAKRDRRSRPRPALHAGSGHRAGPSRRASLPFRHLSPGGSPERTRGQ